MDVLGVNNEVESFIVPRRDKDAARTHALAALRQGVWEASQFLAFSEIHEYVEDVIGEIVRDDP